MTALSVGARPARRLILVDIENLLGMPPESATAEHIRFALRHLCSRVEVVPGHDLVVVACNPALCLAVYGVLPGARITGRSGPDGADQCLLDALDDIALLERSFDGVVIGSGDHCFTAPVQRLTHTTHLDVTVAAIARSLNKELRLCAHQFVPLNPPTTAPHPCAGLRPTDAGPTAA